LREASEKQAREAESRAQERLNRRPPKSAACQYRQVKLDNLVAKGSEGSGLDDLRSFSRTVTCNRWDRRLWLPSTNLNAEAAKRAATLPNSPELVRSAQTQTRPAWMYDRQNRWHAQCDDQERAWAIT